MRRVLRHVMVSNARLIQQFQNYIQVFKVKPILLYQKEKIWII